MRELSSSRGVFGYEQRCPLVCLAGGQFVQLGSEFDCWLRFWVSLGKFCESTDPIGHRLSGFGIQQFAEPQIRCGSHVW